jgi:hypothetical protein
MPDALSPEVLLAGPRGRRLCLIAAESLDPRIVPLRAEFASDPLDPEVARRLADALTALDPAPLAAEGDELRMLEPLAMAVSLAAYWQPPYEDDVVAASPEVREALDPIAQALLDSPATGWWSTGLADDQRFVEWDDRQGARLDLRPASDKLAAWKAATLAEEVAAASRPSNPAAPFSGSWWSSPANSGLPRTARPLAGLGSVGLDLEEDGFGELEARVVPIVARRGIRVCELADPGDWVSLVEEHPLEVTLSRRHDWWNVTGLDGAWLIPDWQAVAQEFDVVHLTVAGYLATAGRALEAGSGHTLLAGWSPDESFWLTDALETTETPTEWRRPQPGARWVRSGLAG